MTKKTCILTSSLLCSLLLGLFYMTSYAGQWNNSSGNWYYLDDNGNYLKNQWAGNYYLGADGVMMTNSWTPDGYYVGADGAWNGQPALSASNAWLYQDSSSLEGLYQYSYTHSAGEGLLYEIEINPVTVNRNQDGSYTAMVWDSFETAILTLESSGSYTACDEGGHVFWKLDETGLCIESGDVAYYYTKKMINSQTTTSNDSSSYLTSPGRYFSSTHIAGSDSPYVHDITITGNVLTLKGTLDYWVPRKNIKIHLQEGVYNFQLYSGTEYGEIEDGWIPKSKADFEQLVSRGCGPLIYVEIENGVVSSVYCAT